MGRSAVAWLLILAAAAAIGLNEPKKLAQVVADADGDGLDNRAEARLGTHEHMVDSDYDGLGDWLEVDPLSPLRAWAALGGAEDPDPLHRDLYVVVFGEVPELEDVVEYFEGAPVANWDNESGVRFHVVEGGEIVGNLSSFHRWARLQYPEFVVEAFFGPGNLSWANASGAAGVAFWELGQVVVRTDMTAPFIRHTMMHELEHLFWHPVPPAFRDGDDPAHTTLQGDLLCVRCELQAARESRIDDVIAGREAWHFPSQFWSDKQLSTLLGRVYVNGGDVVLEQVRNPWFHATRAAET